MKKLLFLPILLLTLISLAQTRTNFSGTWLIDKSKIDFGPAPEWILPRSFTLKQEASKLTVTRVMLDAQLAEHPLTEAFAFDGNITNAESYNHAKRATALHWSADQQTFKLDGTSTNIEGAVTKTSEDWSLADNGKTLIMIRSVEQSNGMKYTTKAYYNKR